MREQIVGVLPFVSFGEETIRLDGFLMFSESRIYEISELSRSVQEALDGFAKNQKAFIQKTYGNRESRVTFLLPTDPYANRKQLEHFLDILFFYLLKGSKLINLLSMPNIFCREDFRLFVLKIPDANSQGEFLSKKKFKFHIVEKLSKYIISPIGCENVVTQNQQGGYIFKDIKLDHQGKEFHFLMRCLSDSTRRNFIHGISFCNRTLSCELADQERFVWLSSSLEAFFQIGKQRDKARAIRKNIKNLLGPKVFQVMNKHDAIANVADLITVVYDYRSSYVHGGETLTGRTVLEAQLARKLGKLDFVVALINLVSVLLVHERIPDIKLEGVLHALFCNQECFEYVVGIYKDSADKAIKKLQNPDSISVIHRFLLTADFQAISFDRQKIEKCLNNILHILAKFASAYQRLPLARQVQRQINTVASDDRKKFKKWSDFLQNSDGSVAPEPVYFSMLTFQHLFRLLQYEFALY